MTITISRRRFTAIAAAAGLTKVLKPMTTHAATNVNDPFLDHDSVGLADLVRRRQVTPKELLEQVIRRTEAMEGSINALTTRSFDRALARIESETLDGPFAGVPFMVKDMIDVEGIRRTDGAGPAFHRVPETSSAYIKAIEDGGLNIVAATNVPEMATLPTTVNIEFGATHNPWDLTKSPAGSSGGSAAAVAAGYVPMAHGTDGGGSIRMPSSWCGVFGLKPSRERMLSGEPDGSHDIIKHNHVITRTVRDSAAAFALTEDRSETAKYKPVGLVSGASKERLCIGVTAVNASGREPSPAIKMALDDAATLCADLGHRVEPVDFLPIDNDEFFDRYEVIFLARMSALIAMVEAQTGKSFEDTDLLSPLTKSFALASRHMEPGALEKSMAYFEILRTTTTRHFSNIDVWLTPVTPFEQSALDIFDPRGDWETQSPKMREFMCYPVTMNVTGSPAMSVPLHWTEGNMPLGAHFSAMPGRDEMLLHLAFELEQARPWADKWAPNSARFIK